MLPFVMAHPALSRLRDVPSPNKIDSVAPEAGVVRYIDLKRDALGHAPGSQSDSDFFEIARPLLRNYRQKDLMLGNLLCPADRRIQAFLTNYLKDVCPEGIAQIPGNTFLLDRPGLGRVLSLPLSTDTFTSPYLNSYRV